MPITLTHTREKKNATSSILFTLIGYFEQDLKCNTCMFSTSISVVFRPFLYGYGKFVLDMVCIDSALWRWEVGELFNHESFGAPPWTQSFYASFNGNFRCKACDAHISEEFYGCPNCSFFIFNVWCIQLRREIQHFFFHLKHTLTLTPFPADYPNNRAIKDDPSQLSSSKSPTIEIISRKMTKKLEKG